MSDEIIDDHFLEGNHFLTWEFEFKIAVGTAFLNNNDNPYPERQSGIYSGHTVTDVSSRSNIGSYPYYYGIIITIGRLTH